MTLSEGKNGCRGFNHHGRWGIWAKKTTNRLFVHPAILKKGKDQGPVKTLKFHGRQQKGNPENKKRGYGWDRTSCVSMEEGQWF